MQIGFDGIAIANSKKGETFKLTRKDIFLALAKQVPGKADGELIDNPYKTWKEVNADLPAIKIEVLGPPPTSGTRDAFAELAMEGGCKKIAWIKALKKTDKRKYKSICHSVREDGAFIEAGENDNLIVQKLTKNPDALGIFWKKLKTGEALFSVEDKGQGIAPEHLAHLTERFYRVDKGRSQDVGGTGLGLAIVQHIIQRHGGYLEIDSKEGVGSIFSVYLPNDRILV